MLNGSFVRRVLTLCLLSVLCGVPCLAQSIFHGFVSDHEPNDTLGSGHAILLGDSLAFQPTGVAHGFGEFSSSSDVDSWLILMSANDRLLVLTIPIDSLPNGFSAADTVVTVFDPLNNFLATSDDAGSDFPSAGGARGSTLRVRSGTVGAFRVKVESFLGVGQGRYAIVIARISAASDPYWLMLLTNTTAATAERLNPLLSGPTAGRCVLVNPNDMSYWSVPLTTGDILYASTIPTAIDFERPDTIVDVIAPDGTTVLVSNDDDDTSGDTQPGPNRGSTVRFRAAQPGVYFLRARSFGGTVGDYQLVTGVIPASSIDACPGDADNDRIVTFNDISAVLLNFSSVCK